MSRARRCLCLAVILFGTAAADAARASSERVEQYTLYGCVNGTTFFSMDRSAAQAYLPPGFVAGDAADLVARRLPLTLPDDLPRAVVGMDAATCASSSLGDEPTGYAQAYVQVRTPDLGPDHRIAPADLEFFDVSLHVPNDPYGKRLRSRVRAQRGTVTACFAATAPGIGAGCGELKDVRGPLHSFSYRTAAGYPDSQFGLLRIWFAGRWGVGYLEVDLDGLTVSFGGVESCRVRAGSFQGAFVGGTACVPGSAIAMALTGFDETQTLHTLPGVFPQR